MTDQRIQRLTEELVQLRRENLALRLEVVQLRDIVKQRDAEIATLPYKPHEHVDPLASTAGVSVASWGQPGGSPGEVPAVPWADFQEWERWQGEASEHCQRIGYAELD